MWTRVQTAKQELREHLAPGYWIQAADTAHFFSPPIREWKEGNKSG